jgi:hypothetical protein
VSMSTGSLQNPVAKPSNTPRRVRVIIFRVVATFADLFVCGGRGADGVGAVGAVAAGLADTS